MDLLATYSSDESVDIFNDTHENNTAISSINYFNLQNDISDENVTSADESLKQIYCYNVSVEAHILSEDSYGPNKKGVDDSSNEPGSSGKMKSKAENYLKIPCKRSNSFHTDYSYDLKLLKVEEKCDNKLRGYCPEYTESNTVKLYDANESEEIPIAEPKLYYTDIITEKSDNDCFFPRHQSKLFEGHDSAVSSLSWCISRYSHLLMTSSFDFSLKLWDMNNSDCVKVLNTEKPVKAAKWSLCGKSIIYGGFNKKVVITDVNTSKTVAEFKITANVSSIECHPLLENIFLVGTQDNVLAFDCREASKPIKQYSSDCKYILDMVFINENQEFACSTELVSRDSSDKTIMVWDFASGALLSNQIYSERFTCPCLCVQPGEKYFAAQSNGDYLVMFSTKRPYKRQNKRFSGHKVSGYGVGCDFSNDGEYLVSGDADGSLYMYSSITSHLIKKINISPGVPIVKVAWHPVLPSTIAMAGWDGSVRIWN